MVAPEGGLVAAVLAHLRPELRGRIEADPEARALLVAALERAREEWPQLAPPDDTWAAYLAARIPEGDDVQRLLSTVQAESLYLCCACAAGDPTAVELFRETYTPVIAAALRRLRLGEAATKEVLQQLLVDLLAGDQAQPPMIGRYGGLGRLANWLRVVAARTGRKHLEREKRLVPTDDHRLADELLADDVSLPGLKAEYQSAFRAAFKAALSELGPREISLVRYHYGDGMRLEQMGAIFHVHASTVSRWLSALRARLLEETHQRLATRLEIPPGECSTIIRMIQDDVDLTLKTLLGRGRTPGG